MPLTTDDQKLRAMAQENFYFFCLAILGFTFMVPHVHGKLCDFIQNNPANRKQITLPRGFLKTTVCSIAYPIWLTLPPRDAFVAEGIPDPWHNPNYRILIVQNIIENALKRINVIKTIFEKNDLFRRLFPEIIPENFNKTRWADSSAQIRRTEAHPEATYEAAGVGSSLTSRHYTHIIEDDIIAAKKDDLSGMEATPSAEDIEKAIGFHRLALSLLVNQKQGLVLNIGTRWAIHDVIQYIIDEQMPPYVRFEMSVWDKAGNPTYPERFDLETLTSLRGEQGDYIFASQYENKPMSEEEMVFQDTWFQYYDAPPLREEMKVWIAVDPAISKKTGSDLSVVLAAGTTWDRRLYVLDYIADKLNPSELIEAIFNMNTKWKPEMVYIETVAWQQALKHFVDKESRDRKEWIPTEEFNPGPNVSKEARIRGIQPIAMAKKLYLRRHQRDLRLQLLNLTDVSYKDDIADALATIVRKISYPLRPRDPEVASDLYSLDTILKELRLRAPAIGTLPFSDQTLLTTSEVVDHMIQKYGRR